MTKILAAMAAVLMLAACSSSGGNAGDSCGAACVTQTTDTPVDVATSPDVASQVYDWYQNGVGDDLTAISDDEGAVSDAADDVVALQAACGDLKIDVIAVESDPAAPDDVIRTNMAQAMDSYSTAATECLAGDFESAGTDMGAGNDSLGLVTERVTELGS